MTNIFLFLPFKWHAHFLLVFHCDKQFKFFGTSFNQISFSIVDLFFVELQFHLEGGCIEDTGSVFKKMPPRDVIT